MQELAFAWPQTSAALGQLAAAARVVLPAVGLGGVPLGAPLRQLSDGFQRRAALAAALVRRPAVLLLDEPLAGLDWRARADVAGVLGALLFRAGCDSFQLSVTAAAGRATGGPGLARARGRRRRAGCASLRTIVKEVKAPLLLWG